MRGEEGMKRGKSGVEEERRAERSDEGVEAAKKREEEATKKPKKPLQKGLGAFISMLWNALQC